MHACGVVRFSERRLLGDTMLGYAPQHPSILLDITQLPIRLPIPSTHPYPQLHTGHTAASHQASQPASHEPTGSSIKRSSRCPHRY